MEYAFEALNRLQLQSLCFEQRNLTLYAVIEGAKPPEGFQTTGALIYTLEQVPSAYPLLLSANLSITSDRLLDVSPWLVEIKLDTLLYHWLIENASTHPFIFFWSKASLASLKPFMVNLLTVISRQGNPLYFRYYDPAVFSVMIKHFSDQSIVSKMGDISGIATIAADKHLLTEPKWYVRWFDSTERLAPHQPLAATLTSLEWKAISDLRSHISLKQMMEYLKNSYSSHLRDIDPAALRTFVSTSVEQGERFGFKTQSELEQWLDLQLYFGNAFEGDQRYSWAKSILDNDQLTSDVKLQKLNLYLDQYQARSAQ